MRKVSTHSKNYGYGDLDGVKYCIYFQTVIGVMDQANQTLTLNHGGHSARVSTARAMNRFLHTVGIDAKVHTLNGNMSVTLNRLNLTHSIESAPFKVNPFTGEIKE